MSDRPLPQDAEVSPRRRHFANRKRLTDGVGGTKNTNQAGLRVAVYSRVSSEEQVEGHSLDAQKNVCREVCERRGWIVVENYEDPGYSAKDDKRPAFKQMIADAQKDKFDVILVHKLDRFSRSIEQTLNYFRLLNEHGVVFASATENFDFTRPEGRLFFNMMAVFAQWYLENLSTESVKAKEELFRKGLHNGSAPFGYVKDKKTRRCEIVPDEAEQVKAAFELAATGNYTHRMIADLLNENYTTRRGRRFSKDTVIGMLRNEFYYGMVSYRENIRPGIHEAIITKELYEKSQEMTRSRATSKKGAILSQHNKHGVKRLERKYYLLQRIIRCDHCGRYLRIVPANYGKHYYYREVSAERGLTCDIAGKSIRMDLADSQVLEILGQLKLPEDWQDDVVARLQDQDRVELVKKRKEALEEKIHRFDDVYFSSGSLARITYLEQKAKLVEELESLVIPEQGTVIEKGLVLESLGEYLKEATQEELSVLVRTIVDSVYTDFVDKRITRIKPTLDFAELFRVAAKTYGWKEVDQDGSFILRPA